MGVQQGEPVEYNPRSNRDRTPWTLPGTDIRYGAGELEVREATPRERASNARKAKREASKAPKRETATDEVKTSQRATNDVLRNLDKDHPDYSFTRAWERMSLDSLERFTEDAKAWLGDRSELGTSTLEKANWQEVYDYLRVMADKKPENERQEAIAATMERTAQETLEAARERHAQEASERPQEQPTEEAPTETPQEASVGASEAPGDDWEGNTHVAPGEPTEAPTERLMPSIASRPGTTLLGTLLERAGVEYSLKHERFEVAKVTVIRYVINGKNLSPAEVIENHLS
jgi:hypothetical protein